MDEQPAAQADGAATDDGRIADIREREQDATPGPWECYEPTPPDPDGGLWVMYETPEDGWVHTITHGDNCFTEDDADFVANARDDIPYLLDRLDALTAERDDLAARLAVAERVIREIVCDLHDTAPERQGGGTSSVIGSYCSICGVYDGSPCCHSLGGPKFGQGGACVCGAPGARGGGEATE